MPDEDPPADRGTSRVGIVPHLGFELAFDRSAGAHGSPFTLAEVGPAIVAQAHDVDPDRLRPVLPDLEGGGDAFAAVEPGESLAAEPFEAEAEPGVQVRPDEVPQGPLGSHMADIAGAGKYETKPEAQQGIGQIVADRARRGRLVGQGIAPLDIAELDELGLSADEAGHPGRS